MNRCRSRFIRDLLILFDDLSSSVRAAANGRGRARNKRGKLAQWRDNLENAIHSLIEILHRMEVSEIEPKEIVDRALPSGGRVMSRRIPEDDGRIVMRVKRGFLWRDRFCVPKKSSRNASVRL